MITSPRPLAATVEPMVAVPRLMTIDSRMPARMTGSASGSSTPDRRWRGAHAHALAPLRASAANLRQAAQRVLEDRQQAVEEQRDQRRRLAETDDRHRQRQHRDRRKGLADIHEAARQRQELGAARAGDEDPQPTRRPWCWRAPPRTRCPDATRQATAGCPGCRSPARRSRSAARTAARTNSGVARNADQERQRHRASRCRCRASCRLPRAGKNRLDGDRPSSAPLASATGSASLPHHMRCASASRRLVAASRGRPRRVSRLDRIADRPSDSSRKGRSAVPTRRSTNSSAGRVSNSAGLPYCSRRASSITAILSPR